MASTRSAESTVIFPAVKIVLAGDGSVGKTSLIQRYCSGTFPESLPPQSGVDFQIKIIEVGGKPIKLSIWDIAGQEQFGAFRDSFYRGAKAIALLYDVSNPATMENLPRWQMETSRICPSARLVIVGTKIDLERQVLRSQVEEWASSMGFPYLETSARTGQGVDELFGALARVSAPPSK